MLDHPTPGRRRTLTGAAVAALFALAGLAACGGGDDDVADDPPSTEADSTTTSQPDDGAPDDEGTDDDEDEELDDPCDIVSDEVVLEVLPLDEIARREPTGIENQATGCIKGSARTDDISTGSYVSVSFLTGSAALVEQMGAQEGAVAVSGLGDEATFLPTAGSLVIAVGADSFQIQVFENGRPGSQEDAVTVGEDVLGG